MTPWSLNFPASPCPALSQDSRVTGNAKDAVSLSEGHKDRGRKSDRCRECEEGTTWHISVSFVCVDAECESSTVQAGYEVKLSPSRSADLNGSPHQLMLQMPFCTSSFLCRAHYLSCFSLPTLTAHLQYIYTSY